MSRLAPWLADAWRTLAGALADGRLHHGLLLAAPAGYGKRALANALVAAALCQQRRADGHACGQCRACTLLAAGTHPDRVHITFEVNPKTDKLRTEIVIEQIRDLSQRLALSSQFGGLQLAIVEPADRLNAAAANALLKTLEEPAANTVIVLVADEPARLPATIRSRCQRIDIRPPAPDEALAWLRGQGIAAERAAAAFEASLGNPGRALAWCADDTLVVRSGCADDLAALAQGRRTATEIADRWVADQPETRLSFAAALARDEARRLARGEPGRFGLTTRDEIPKLAAWFGRANAARGLLATTLRADLVLLDLLRTWPVRRAPH